MQVPLLPEYIRKGYAVIQTYPFRLIKDEDSRPSQALCPTRSPMSFTFLCANSSLSVLVHSQSYFPYHLPAYREVKRKSLSVDCTVKYFVLRQPYTNFASRKIRFLHLYFLLKAIEYGL